MDGGKMKKSKYEVFMKIIEYRSLSRAHPDWPTSAVHSPRCSAKDTSNST